MMGQWIAPYEIVTKATDMNFPTKSNQRHPLYSWLNFTANPASCITYLPALFDFSIFVTPQEIMGVKLKFKEQRVTQSNRVC